MRKLPISRTLISCALALLSTSLASCGNKATLPDPRFTFPPPPVDTGKAVEDMRTIKVETQPNEHVQRKAPDR